MSATPGGLGKVLLLASLIPRRPQEFYDRMRTFLEVQADALLSRKGEYRPLELENLIAGLEKTLGVEIAPHLQEAPLAQIEDELTDARDDLASLGPYTLVHNADFSLARLCYAVCRAIGPRTVLETGVAYGVTSAFILQALDANHKGHLHSVDLPPLGFGADRFVGCLIPDRLRLRWLLHRGVSRRVLPVLLPRVEPVDLFIHDSMHTYRGMSSELQSVTSFLSTPAIVLADDVEGNRAFYDWAQWIEPSFWAIGRETDKSSLFGAAAFGPRYAPARPAR